MDTLIDAAEGRVLGYSDLGPTGKKPYIEVVEQERALCADLRAASAAVNAETAKTEAALAEFRAAKAAFLRRLGLAEAV